jgi:hypothetical protein
VDSSSADADEDSLRNPAERNGTPQAARPSLG